MNEIAHGLYRPAVGLVIFNSEKKVLAGLRRRRDPKGPNWQLPQGGRDGEDVEPAAYREMGQETGLTREDVVFVGTLAQTTRYEWPSDFRRDEMIGQEHTWVVFRKLDDQLPDLKKATDYEFDRLEWLDFETLIMRSPVFRIPVYRIVQQQLE